MLPVQKQSRCSQVQQCLIRSRPRLTAPQQRGTQYTGMTLSVVSREHFDLNAHTAYTGLRFSVAYFPSNKKKAKEQKTNFNTCRDFTRLNFSIAFHKGRNNRTAAFKYQCRYCGTTSPSPYFKGESVHVWICVGVCTRACVCTCACLQACPYMCMHTCIQLSWGEFVKALSCFPLGFFLPMFLFCVVRKA